MAKPSINVSCSLQDDFAASLGPGAVRAAVRAELGTLAEDLGLDVSFTVDVRENPEGDARIPTSAGFCLYIDGEPIESRRYGSTPERRLRETVHANAEDLITTRLADAMWTDWGGTSVGPAAYTALLRQLVRYRLRPDRIAKAVPAWRDQDPLRVFEDALAQVSRRIVVYVHPDRLAEMAPRFTSREDEKWAMMTDGLFYELGILAGECEMVADSTLPADSLRIRINDLRSAPKAMLAAGESLVNDTVERLRLFKIDGREAVNPANGNECAIIASDDAGIAEKAGLTTWDPAGWVILLVSAEVRQSAAGMLSGDTLQFQMGKLEQAFPYLTAYVKNGIGSERLARVLRYLLEEGLSIRNLRHIIDSLATASPPTIDTSRLIVFTGSYTAIRPLLVRDRSIADPAAAELAESVRNNLKQYISHKYTRGQNTLIVYLVAPELEERLRLHRPLSRAERRWLLDAVEAEVGSLPPTAQNPVILTTMEVRRRVRAEVEASFPYLVVLSYQELNPDMNIQPIARISPEDPRGEGPLDIIDKAFDELRYDDAQTLIAAAMDTAWPPSWFEARLAELLFLWNEAGRRDRVAENLGIWLKSSVPSEEARAGIGALHANPNQAAVREWLASRDGLGVRRLQAHYLPGAEDLVHVQGGSFTMGDPEAKESDRPAHAVEMSDFFLATLPVTCRQFAVYLFANDLPIPEGCVHAEDAVRCISWHEAVDYCRWLSQKAGLESVYEAGQPAAGSGLAEDQTFVTANHARGGFRLPTEAEWEYAARGGVSSQGFRFAGSDHLADVGDVNGNDPVGMRGPNELGLYDMSGGPPEWCLDWYAPDYYQRAPSKDPLGPPTGEGKVCRGGDVTGSGKADACTVFARDARAPDRNGLGSLNIGFRLARSAVVRSKV